MTREPEPDDDKWDGGPLTIYDWIGYAAIGAMAYTITYGPEWIFAIFGL